MLSRLLKQRNTMQMVRAPARQMGAFVNHRDTPDNLEETPFEFTEESYVQVK